MDERELCETLLGISKCLLEIHQTQHHLQQKLYYTEQAIAEGAPHLRAVYGQTAGIPQEKILKHGESLKALDQIIQKLKVRLQEVNG